MMQKRFSIPAIAGIAALAVAGGVGAALAATAPAVVASSGPAPAALPIDTPMAAPVTDGPKPTGVPDLAGITDGNPPTEGHVLALVTGNKAEFPQLTASYVKTTTLGALVDVLQAVPSGYAPDQKIIVATGVGTFVPEQLNR